jgi:hypothetical protein
VASDEVSDIYRILCVSLSRYAPSGGRDPTWIKNALDDAESH